MEHFSDRLRHARNIRKLSQTELARASGLSQGAISSYETGSRKSPTGLVQLAKALNVDPVWLITGTGIMEPGFAQAGHGAVGKVQDVEPQSAFEAWPFTSIDSNRFWTLPETQRRVAERTFAAMLDAMHKENDNV